MLHAVRLAVEFCRESDEPREISVGILAGFDSVLGVEKIRHRLIDAGELAHDIRRGPIAEAAEIERREPRATVADINQRVVVHPIHAAELARVDRFEARNLARVQRFRRSDSGRGFVAQPPSEAGVGAFVEAEDGCAFRVVLQILLKEAVH